MRADQGHALIQVVLELLAFGLALEAVVECGLGLRDHVKIVAGSGEGRTNQYREKLFHLHGD
jgi:hypothetical protein